MEEPIAESFGERFFRFGRSQSIHTQVSFSLSHGKKLFSVLGQEVPGCVSF